MYFRDEEGKWHKCANESDLRDYTLLEAGAWKTIKALKTITFPIEKAQAKGDEVLQKDKNLEEYREAQALPATEPAPTHEPKNEPDFKLDIDEKK